MSMFCKTRWSFRGKKTRAISTWFQVDTVDKVDIEIERQWDVNCSVVINPVLVSAKMKVDPEAT